MSRLRFLLVTVVVLALVGLAGWWHGTDGPTPATLERAPVPAVRPDGDLGTTWYCAAGTASVPAQHLVFLANPTDRAITARLTGYTAAGATPTRELEVPARGPLVVDIGTVMGDPTASVLVESPSASLSVDHQLVSEEGADRDACATSTSDVWTFPVLSTTADAGARLTLFNPFPGDAGVDISIGLDTGTRTPARLTGVVVPARSSKVIDLAAGASRRDQFTATVRSRSGRVVAEMVQNFDGSNGPRGMQMAVGVPAANRRWVFAGGFSGSGVAERLVVQNPSDSRAHALVQVTPYGAASDPPEPLQIDVEAGRYVVVDLSAETRIPGVGYHAIEVEADQQVVVARTTTITGPPEPPPDPSIVGRPALERGVALSTGTPVVADRWVVPSIDAGQDPNPVVLLHNPGRGIAVVRLTGVTGGSAKAVDRAAKVEVAPGDSVALPLAAVGAEPGEATILVVSSEPLAVERLTTFPAQGDLAFDLAVPTVDAVHPLRPVNDG